MIVENGMSKEKGVLFIPNIVIYNLCKKAKFHLFFHLKKNPDACNASGFVQKISIRNL